LKYTTFVLILGCLVIFTRLCQNPSSSSRKSYVFGAVGAQFVRSFFSLYICYAVGTPELLAIFIVSLLSFSLPSRPNPVLEANTANRPHPTSTTM
jgi:hypothetical protein